MNRPTIRLPAAIVTLSEEHRYMNLLVKTLDEHLESMLEPAKGDYFLMQDIVRYMHDYSDQVHHPTEDLMFDKLVKRNPSRKKDVARLRREHGFLDKNTSELMELLEVATERRTAEDAKAVHDAASTYIQRLRKHMQFEEAELFPSAARCLTSKDWGGIEARLEASDDPLFGATVQRDYRVLYEYFADRTEKVSRKVTNYSFLQLDNMIVSADVIESGVQEMWELLREHGSSLGQEYREVSKKSADGRSIAARVALHTAYAGTVGRTALTVGSDAAGIYLRTLRSAAVSFFRGTA
jgi:hemerythrin-like domain-containing protein